jgi:hypothetical protein
MKAGVWGLRGFLGTTRVKRIIEIKRDCWGDIVQLRRCDGCEVCEVFD